MKNNNAGSAVFCVFLCLTLLCTAAYSQQDSDPRNYLTAQLQSSGFHFLQNDLLEWRASQKKNYLQKIRALPDSVRTFLIDKANNALAYKWPALPATLYLEYKQNGNRTRYEQKLNERRDHLNALVIGELVSQDKKYLPQIVDGLWATLEESTWEIPAIIGLQRAGNGLPDPDEEIIGLVSAETAVTIAVMQDMLHDELQEYSPMINKRIDLELRKRIFDPYLQRDDYWWMGFKGQSVNNWNAWINTNVLQTALLSEMNEDTLALLVNKIFRSADHFINQYPADGGCDEGPSYWSEAGGKLIRLLHLMNSVSRGKLSWTGNRLIHNMGSYIYKVHIAADYFVNFADAIARTIPDPGSVYLFGDMFNDDALKRFGAYLFDLSKNSIPDNNLANFLQTVEVFDQLTAIAPRAPLPAYSFLPDLEVATARSAAGSASGLFLAVQAGNNGESHNHNDVGNFIIYADGQPVIVDAGVGTYTAQTFSSKRYDLWNMQSQWHNCPTVNGVMQKEGRQFKATGFSGRAGKKDEVEISMDIAKAYPPEAFVKSWKRQFLFDRSKNFITLSENYLFEKRTGNSSINFLSHCTMKKEKEGEIGFYNEKGLQVLLLTYKPGNLQPVMEEKILLDKKLADAWGKQLYRLTFAINGKALEGKNKFEFSIPKGLQKL